MTTLLVFILVAVAVIVLAHIVAERVRVPAAALLTVAGLVYGLLPGPNIELVPEVVLTFVLPPLLYSAALSASLLAIRQNLRAVVSLSVLLVLVTALLVGLGVSLLVPGVTLAAGIAMGAAVAPPDPVAALSVGRRAGLPSKLVTLIEGEGLLNDATALTILSVAVTAAVSGSFAFGTAAVRFVILAAGGLVVGIGVALVVRGLRRFVREPVLANCVSLATPFAAYLFAERIHVSGVLAVVVAGLLIGHETPRLSTGASRLQTGAVWRLVDLLLEGFVFLLIGEQLPVVLAALHGEDVSHVVLASVVTVVVVLGLRPLWLVLTQLLPPALHTRLGREQGPAGAGDRRLRWREVVVLSWAGTRGVISLAAIFTLPLATAGGDPFPGRDILLFCTYLVVIVTLVGQGSTFVPLVHALGLRADAADAARTRNQARLASIEAAQSRLEQLVTDEEVSERVAAAMRTDLERVRQRYQVRLDLLENADTGELPHSPEYEAAARLRRELLEAQREELLRWRDAGRLPDPELRTLEAELDHQERVLPDRFDRR